MMNIWHHIAKERISPEDFAACIEISSGSRNKYELDKQTGMLKLDRVLYTSMNYPANYGFIPRTYAADDDPLDVLVLCEEAIHPMTLVQCYPIGVVMMTDGDSSDEKIICVPFGDPSYNHYQDISELPRHVLDKIQHFLEFYKTLEGKPIKVGEPQGRESAIEVIKSCLERYDRVFAGRV